MIQFQQGIYSHIHQVSLREEGSGFLSIPESEDQALYVMQTFYFKSEVTRTMKVGQDSILFKLSNLLCITQKHSFQHPHLFTQNQVLCLKLPLFNVHHIIVTTQV